MHFILLSALVVYLVGFLVVEAACGRLKTALVWPGTAVLLICALVVVALDIADEF